MEEDGAAQEVRNAFTKRSHYWQQISDNKFKQLGWMKRLLFTVGGWGRR
jgi:hypothetical protein